ncbi:hypothetical protein KHS38_11905 [Mucilaginibacter sp. Bleaf8]|uniref:hypothetical protein n=1 Tax=Mucilaginibacter sp. Bleaf8 TaxID=2834430 RepID=UPI001BCC4109|nr:hypothetical protein [Mucilaginibacter sp. Bleaf8]MBS7565110.1 hypothetical protein [Mucilaginibacter sp. Bleaf8]
MNTDLTQRTALAHEFAKICPMIFPEVFVKTTLTVERAQYLVDYYGAIKRKDFATAYAIGLESPRDLETLEIEKKAAEQEAAVA